MDLEFSIKYLSGRLKSRKEKIAFNTIIDALNYTESKRLDRNKYFANLYAYALGVLIEKYQTTIDNPVPHRELHKLIQKDFDFIVWDITDKINNRIKYKILENAGMPPVKHPRLLSQGEKEKIIDNLLKLLSISFNRKAFYEDAWTLEEVSKGIQAQIKNFI